MSLGEVQTWQGKEFKGWMDSLQKFLSGVTSWEGGITLPEANIAPENGWLEYEFPFGKAYFQVRAVSFREGNSFLDMPYVNHTKGVAKWSPLEF